MSVEAFARALASRVGNPTRKLILMGYANHAHRDGRNAWCSIDTVADYAECDRRTAQRHVARLLADGFMREGDQDEARRRSGRPSNLLPIVYDVAMDDAAREQWRAAYLPGAGAPPTPGRAPPAAVPPLPPAGVTA